MFRIYEAVLLFDFLPGVSHRVTMSRYSVALKMKCRHTGTAPTEHFEAEADLAPKYLLEELLFTVFFFFTEDDDFRAADTGSDLGMRF